MVINSFFTMNGVAATGLSPIISIWQITGNTRAGVVVDQPTVELGNGFYTFDFGAYSDQNDYTVLVDAGSSMNAFGRYNVASISPVPASVATIDTTTINDIVQGVWNESAVDHMIAGSTGALLNQTKADTTAILVDVVGITQLLQVLKKYERNRTKIDATAKTLTVYDNDGVTPIQVFNLKDGAGAASVAEVMERVPTLP